LFEYGYNGLELYRYYFLPITEIADTDYEADYLEICLRTIFVSEAQTYYCQAIT